MIFKNSANLQPLTSKEKGVLEYLEGYILENGVSPSFQEIKNNFGFASFNSVQRYVKQLQDKGYISNPGGNKKRAITVLNPSSAFQNAVKNLQSESLSLPLYGRVAAGRPIEALDHNEFIDIPPRMVKNPSKSFALRVEGESMIEDGIFDGDIILVQEQKTANNGDIIVADVDNEATVKRFYLHTANKKTNTPQVELRPSNSTMESLWYSPENVEIKAVVLGLIRKY